MNLHEQPRSTNNMATVATEILQIGGSTAAKYPRYSVQYSNNPAHRLSCIHHQTIPNSLSVHPRNTSQSQPHVRRNSFNEVSPKRRQTPVQPVGVFSLPARSNRTNVREKREREGKREAPEESNGDASVIR